MTPTDPGAVMRSEIAAQPHGARGAGRDTARPGSVGRCGAAPARTALRAVRRPGHERPRRAVRQVPRRDPARHCPPGSCRRRRMTAYGARPDLRDVLLVAVVAERRLARPASRRATVARECGALTRSRSPTRPGSALAEAAQLARRRARRRRARGGGDQVLHGRAARPVAAASTPCAGATAAAASSRAARVRRAGRLRAGSAPGRPARRRATGSHRPPGAHRPGLLLPDGPRGALKLMETSYLAGARVQRCRPAARPARDDRRGAPGARRGPRRRGRPGHAPGARAAARAGRGRRRPGRALRQVRAGHRDLLLAPALPEDLAPSPTSWRCSSSRS